MSFLNVAFLWGLPLLAVPVAIHLLSRRRQEVVKWGAMQFLLDSGIRRRKIWRLDDLILMLLRTLAVLGIVLALARPLWRGFGRGGGSERDVIFVWDVSMSMEREYVLGRTSFDSLLDKTRDLMGQLGKGDTIRGLVTIGRGKWLTPEPLPATTDQERQLLDELQRVGVTQSSADWLACLGTALRVAPPRGAKARLVVVISDGQAQGWRQQDQVAWQNLEQLTEKSRIPVAIELHNVIGVAASSHNLAVDKLTTARQLLGVGETFLAEVEIRNHGHISVELATIDWSLDDVSLGQSSVGPLGPGQSKQVTLKQATSQPGISRLKCRMSLRDDLESDNERVLIVETIDNVPLLLVDDSTESDPLKSDKGYLLAALGQDPSGEKTSNNSGVFRVTTITPREVASHPLSNFRAVVFANTPSVDIDDAALSKLTDFVRSGGGLWLALGDRTDPNEFNQKFYRSGGGLSPLPIEQSTGDLVNREEFVTIHPPGREHPATVLLSDTQRLDVDRAKVFQRFPFAAAPARIKVPILLQSGAGDALAIEGFLGRGRIFVQSVPMGVRWSSLPLTLAYVPMVHEWLWYLVQPTAISRNLSPGEPLQVPLPQNEHVREVLLNRPSGNSLILATYKKGEQSIAQSRETDLPGPYEAVLRIEGKDDQARPYQVVRLAEESNLEQWPQELVAKWSGMAGIRLNPNSPLVMPIGTKGQSLGEPLSSTLLGFVVLAFLAELWLVRRTAAQRFGVQAGSGEHRPFADRVFGELPGVRGNH